MDRKAVLIEALKSAGQVILKYDPALVETEIKSTAGDLVTAADIASEKAIIEIIKKSFPNDIIISEEMHEGQELLSDDNLAGLSA